ncbi:MAG TPA: prolyl oligopeptidase family serine peptidase [Puia sp.]|jgi:dipeptidyl aminopeptidase/acylaminoacyl peptidase
MRKTALSWLLLLTIGSAFSQKKIIDHSVYDGWENIAERSLSPDGKYLVYTITPQEGDARLVIRGTESSYAKEIPRGADASITADSRFLIFHIKPFFKDTREARIKKKTPDQSPKDTLAWIELGKDSLVKIPRVRSYKIPEKEGGWLAYLLEKPQPGAPNPSSGVNRGSSSYGPASDSLARIHKLIARADSLSRASDSLRARIAEIGAKGFAALPPTPPARKAGTAGETIDEGTDLILLDLHTGRAVKYPLTSEYYFSKQGNVLVIETTRKNSDTASKALILWVDTHNGRTDTVLKGFHDARNYAIDEPGKQLAFVAERDSVARALVKFYRLWYYTPGMDSAIVRADRSTIPAARSASPTAKPLPLTISPDYTNFFSRDGSRLFLGLTPIRPAKDTTLVDFETARLDVWNYNDDYLAPQQLVRLNEELKRSYLAVIGKDDAKLVPLGDVNCETVVPSWNGNGPYALGSSSKRYRIQQQWEENNLQDLWLVDLRDGSRQPVMEKVRGGATLSPDGRFMLWYDWHQKNWFTYDIRNAKITNITAGIRTPLYDEEDDHPDDPPPHGVMGWKEGDRLVYIYDKYDIWQCDPAAQTPPVNLTRGLGRRYQNTFRYVRLDREDPVIHDGQWALLSVFNQKDMSNGLALHRMGAPFTGGSPDQLTGPQSYNGFFKAKNNWTLAWLQGSFNQPYDVCLAGKIDTTSTGDHILTSPAPHPVSHINAQQSSYNWFTVELHHWKMLDGRMSEGLLYKPENFDSTKKYPILFYFYERDAATRYQYIAPQPVRASINIPYFVSNGYLVFDPDIFYKTGQPGEDAYNSVMSAVRYLSRFKWVDTTKMALQGHSWGGYQVAYLVTRTHIFAAAEAGAPVANMTSAYGGIRWGPGISRQFQYERSQSRLGASLWQKPELYIKNSPLFRADKVTTPLLMMHNDADGSVPWYQGIEYFSALRRLGKKTWLIEYNGEDHGLTERRNRKDWSIRLGQFFGHYLKGEPAPHWMTTGVPATLKGIDWGLGTE